MGACQGPPFSFNFILIHTRRVIKSLYLMRMISKSSIHLESTPSILPTGC